MSRPFLFENNKTNTTNKDTTLKNNNTLKKKGIKNLNSHQTSKHIHQSPLKAIEADNYDELTDKKKMSPEPYYPEEEDEFPTQLNQSF